jgi:hypothetical protein
VRVRCCCRLVIVVKWRRVASRRVLRVMDMAICQVPVTGDQIMFAPGSWCSDSAGAEDLSH